MSVLSIIFGILTIICGISLMATPLITFMSTGLYVIILFFVFGIVGIVRGIAGKDYGRRFIFSVASLILGILGFVIPGAALMNNFVILYMAAIWFIARGIMSIIDSINLHRAGASTGVMVLGIVLGVVDFALGCYSLAHPMVLAISLGILIGIYFIETGISMIVLGTAST